MKRKVLAMVLCMAVMASTMGFVVVAKTSDVSMKPEENFRTVGISMVSVATNSNADDGKQDIEAEEDVVDDHVPTDVKEVSKIESVDNVASPSAATRVSTEEELQSALQKSGRIILDGDIQVTEPLKVMAGATIVIDGDNHRIYSGKNPDLWGIMRIIGEDAEVSLQNITIDATGMDLDKKLASGRYQDYYAIFTGEGTKLTINGGTNIICNDREEGIEIKNQEKGGIFLKGKGIMTGGEISGFYGGAISVMDEFTLEDGLLSRISEGGGAINNVGTTTINGGRISRSDVGVFNSGDLIMIDGVITDNKDGIVANIQDNQTGELYYPEVILTGGFITDNERYAIHNKKRGTLIINGARISGALMSEMRLFGESQKSGSKAVIRNENNSIVKFISGEIVSNAANEIAIYNDATSTIEITGGTISANGSGLAIQNDNTSADAVKHTGGTVSGTIINKPVSSSSGSSGGSGSSGRVITGNSAEKLLIPETPGAWVQDQIGWKFTTPNQTLYTNSWVRSKNHWYWVGADSYMKTGWNQIAEKWYYLTPVSGEMKTGWLQDGDSWYYLDEKGARKTGWIQDGTQWYYLNQDGTMAANTETPDGYKVDGSGVWV